MADGEIRDEHGLSAVSNGEEWVDVRSLAQQEPFGRGSAQASFEVSFPDGWCERYTKDQLGADRFERAVADYGTALAFAIEQRILAGENDFMVGNTRYTVPTWRREPIKRLRVEWARWRARQ